MPAVAKLDAAEVARARLPAWLMRWLRSRARSRRFNAARSRSNARAASSCSRFKRACDSRRRVVLIPCARNSLPKACDDCCKRWYSCWLCRMLRCSCTHSRCCSRVRLPCCRWVCASDWMRCCVFCICASSWRMAWRWLMYCVRLLRLRALRSNACCSLPSRPLNPDAASRTRFMALLARSLAAIMMRNTRLLSAMMFFRFADEKRRKSPPVWFSWGRCFGWR